MRCLGAGERQVLAMFSLQFVVLGLGASVVGCVLALGGQQLLVHPARIDGSRRPAAADAVAGAVRRLQPASCCCWDSRCRRWSRSPACRRCACCAAISACPARAVMLAYALGAATVALLIAAQAQDAKMALIMIGGIAALLATAAIIARLLVAARAAVAAARLQLALRTGQPAPAAARRKHADRRAGSRTDGVAAVDAGPRRSDAELAGNSAGRRADGVPHQRAAGPGGGRARFPQARAGCRRRFVSDGARPAGGDQRRTFRYDAAARRARTTPRRARVQPLGGGRTAAEQHDRGRPVVEAGRDRWHVTGRWHRRDTQDQARRHADLGFRRHAAEREGDQPAQGRVGQLSREFFRGVPAGCPRCHADYLHCRGPSARRPTPRGSRRCCDHSPTSW